MQVVAASWPPAATDRSSAKILRARHERSDGGPRVLHPRAIGGARQRALRVLTGPATFAENRSARRDQTLRSGYPPWRSPPSKDTSVPLVICMVQNVALSHQYSKYAKLVP